MTEKLGQNINRVLGNQVGQGFISVDGFGRVNTEESEELMV